MQHYQSYASDLKSCSRPSRWPVMIFDVLATSAAGQKQTISAHGTNISFRINALDN